MTSKCSLNFTGFLRVVITPSVDLENDSNQSDKVQASQSDWFAIFVWALSFFSLKWQKSDKSEEFANVNFGLFAWVSGLSRNKQAAKK